MRVISYLPVHYGSYLRQAVEAVAPFVDRIVVLYTPTPSYGHGTPLACPHSEEWLRAQCDGVAGKLTWHRGTWHKEGEHRDTIFSLAPDADLILPVDADEVWSADALARCIKEAYNSPARNFLTTGFEHLWRSFHWACHDPWGPVRLIKPRGSGDQYIGGKVWHLGYAETEEVMRYKWSCHGHQSELRPGWFNDIFMGWPTRRNDLHPVVINDWWRVDPVDPEVLPECLRTHPNFGKDIIR